MVLNSYFIGTKMIIWEESNQFLSYFLIVLFCFVFEMVFLCASLDILEFAL